MFIHAQMFLPTDVLHPETVLLVVIGDVVLAAKLHAVRDPNGRVVVVEEALPIRMDVLRTLFPFASKRTEGGKRGWKKGKTRQSHFAVNSHMRTLIRRKKKDTVAAALTLT